MKDQVLSALREALKKLVDLDGPLFAAPVEEIPQVASEILNFLEAEYGPRKLHEVCLNHRLAIHIDHAMAPILNGMGERMFVDVEFTRNGLAAKVLTIGNQSRVVRPDIIVHNRRDGELKRNFLVGECKKDSCGTSLKEIDRGKIEAFLTDHRYEYQFGLQVLYENGVFSGTLFWKNEGAIDHEALS